MIDAIIDASATEQFLLDPNMQYYSDMDCVSESTSDKVRDNFVNKADRLFDLEQYLGKLRQNSSDVDAISDFTGKIVDGLYNLDLPGFDDPMVKERVARRIAERLQEPCRSLNLAKAYTDSGYLNLAQFVGKDPHDTKYWSLNWHKNNRDRILKKLSAEQLDSVLNNPGLTFYMSGDDEHDRAANLVNKSNQIRQATSEQGERGMAAVIQNDVAYLIKYIPEEQNAFRQICPEMNTSLATSVTYVITNARDGLFKDGKSFNKAAMVEFLEDTYRVIEEIIDDDDRYDKEKSDRWNDNLKPHYVELARALLGPEKKHYKLDKDEDKEERKAEDKMRGLKT